MEEREGGLVPEEEDEEEEGLEGVSLVIHEDPWMLLCMEIGDWGSGLALRRRNSWNFDGFSGVFSAKKSVWLCVCACLPWDACQEMFPLVSPSPSQLAPRAELSSAGC